MEDFHQTIRMLGTANVLLELADYRDSHPNKAWGDFADRLRLMAREAQQIQDRLFNVELKALQNPASNVIKALFG